MKGVKARLFSPSFPLLYVAMVNSGEPQFVIPISCELGADCFIQNYVDHDPGEGVMDYRCGKQSYDGHKGTDFRLKDYVQLKTGVATLAAAAGTVKAVRKNVIDRLPGQPKSFLPGQDCGNGLVIEHGEGWETQYCHLRKNSIPVKLGETVQAGQMIGLVGLTGNTEFPHVHFSVRYQGKNIDPFFYDSSVTLNNSCAQKEVSSLWRNKFTHTLAYQSTQIINSGVAGIRPQPKQVRLGDFDDRKLLPSVSAMVIWMDLIHVKQGSEIVMRIHYPSGKERKLSQFIKKDQAQLFQYMGLKRPGDGFELGKYQADIRVKTNSGESIASKVISYVVKEE